MYISSIIFFHTFPMVLTRSIWFKTKNPLVDDQCLFYGWCWWEILVTNHSQGLITYKGVCPTIVDRIRARRNCCNGRGQFFWVSFLVTRCWMLCSNNYLLTCKRVWPWTWCIDTLSSDNDSSSAELCQINLLCRLEFLDKQIYQHSNPKEEGIRFTKKTCCV